MFDIGFFELLVIAVVGLLVIGPERLPETLRALALTVGRIRRGLRDTRLELEKQIGADDIRRQLHNEEIMAQLEQTRRDINRPLDTSTLLGQHSSSDSPSDRDQTHEKSHEDDSEASSEKNHTEPNPASLTTPAKVEQPEQTKDL